MFALVVAVEPWKLRVLPEGRGLPRAAGPSGPPPGRRRIERLLLLRGLRTTLRPAPKVSVKELLLMPGRCPMLLESRRDELELLSQDTRQVGRSIASDGQSAALGGAFWTEGGDDQVTVRPQRPPQSAHVPALVARRDHEMKHRPLVPRPGGGRPPGSSTETWPAPAHTSSASRALAGRKCAANERWRPARPDSDARSTSGIADSQRPLTSRDASPAARASGPYRPWARP